MESTIIISIIGALTTTAGILIGYFKGRRLNAADVALKEITIMNSLKEYNTNYYKELENVQEENRKKIDVLQAQLNEVKKYLCFRECIHRLLPIDPDKELAESIERDLKEVCDRKALNCNLNCKKSNSNKE